jgi:hypothetical protein
MTDRLVGKFSEDCDNCWMGYTSHYDGHGGEPVKEICDECGGADELVAEREFFWDYSQQMSAKGPVMKRRLVQIDWEDVPNE